MTEFVRENMEVKTNVVPSASGREPVPKSKGQSRGRNRRGHYDNYGRYPSQENYRQQRKDGYNQPQRRGVVSDRRPAPRGGFNRNLDFKKGTRPAVVQDCPLVGPGTGSKKYGSSLNHLLNFKYTPREKPLVYHPRSTNKRYTTFNKEQFIQANFQFVVCDSGDYTVHAMDPDVLVEWDSIEQVRIFSHEVPSCPICLYPPVAAKITRCGHIYCWSCILHYLSLTDKPWHKCPICYEAVHKKALKSVVALESHSFSVEDTITMRLMKRAKNSVLVMPKTDWNEREFKPFTINDKEETRYAKLLLASKEDVLKQIVTPEETALDAQLMEARSEQSEEVCYIEVAIAEVRARRESLSDSKCYKEEVRSLMEDVTLDEEDTNRNQETNWKVLSPNAIQDVGEYTPAFSDEEDHFESEVQEPDKSTYQLPIQTTEDPYQRTELPERTQGFVEHAWESVSGDSSCESARPLSTGSVSTQYYYFYQADDGQNIFLSSLNTRCLIKEYGGLEHCPDTITAKILEMDARSQSEDLRKRYRCLSHLPLTCEFVFCELDIKPPILSQGTLNFFKGEIQQRKQQRQKKLRMEKRREQKAVSNVALPDFSSRSASREAVPVPEHLDLGSDFEFPAQTGQLAISPPSNSAPSPFMQFAASMPNHDEGSAAMAETEAVNVQSDVIPSPPSFAQALRSKKSTETFRKRQEIVTRRPSWAEDSDEGDYAPVPTFQSAFTEALISANWDKYDVDKAQSDAASEEHSGKKHKKNKKKLLFSTGSFMKYT